MNLLSHEFDPIDLLSYEFAPIDLLSYELDPIDLLSYEFAPIICYHMNLIRQIFYYPFKSSARFMIVITRCNKLTLSFYALNFRQAK